VKRTVRPRAVAVFKVTAVACMALLHFGCVVNSAIEAARDQPQGRATITHANGSIRDFEALSCRSGEHQVFLGADFVDSANQVVRLVLDPQGTATLRFFDSSQPLEQGLLFIQSDCEPFELSLNRTGWQIDDIYDLSVSIAFSCRLPSGATAAGTLVATHCH
jgi:hypothetical protein